MAEQSMDPLALPPPRMEDPGVAVRAPPKVLPPHRVRRRYIGVAILCHMLALFNIVSYPVPTKQLQGHVLVWCINLVFSIALADMPRNPSITRVMSQFHYIAVLFRFLDDYGYLIQAALGVLFGSVVAATYSLRDMIVQAALMGAANAFVVLCC